MPALSTARELANSFESAFCGRLSDNRYSTEDIHELVGYWWLGGEDEWLALIGCIVPLYLRADKLSEEQCFDVSMLLQHLDGISFNGRTDRNGAKLRGIEKVQARAWRKLIPTMTPAEIGAILAFLRSPCGGRDEHGGSNELLEWWEWASVQLTGNP